MPWARALAILFGQLTRRVPNSDGGLYAYARYEFGDFAGYLTGWCYCTGSRRGRGNAAIVSSWVFYVDALFGISPSGLGNWGIALVGLWIPAGNRRLAGVRQMAWFQNVTVALKFLPLLFVAVVGWFFVRSSDFGPFNASGGSLYNAVGIAAGVALFSFIGVEVAAITAKRVKNPRLNVGRASVLMALRRRRHHVPGGVRRGDGPRPAPRAGEQRCTVRQRVPDDLPAHQPGLREAGRTRWPRCPGSGR